jgi:L-aspartate oxidase
MMLNFDILIIGSGLAGLSAAIKLADNKKIAIISKKELSVSSSQWAQGGIASAISEEDSIDAHINDTLSSGAGLCDVDVVSYVAHRSQEALKWLSDLGVDFTKDQIKNNLHLTK